MRTRRLSTFEGAKLNQACLVIRIRSTEKVATGDNDSEEYLSVLACWKLGCFRSDYGTFVRMGHTGYQLSLQFYQPVICETSLNVVCRSIEGAAWQRDSVLDYVCALMAENSVPVRKFTSAMSSQLRALKKR